MSKRFEESTTIENSEESNEGTEENILLRSTENLKKVFEEPTVFCQFCKKQCEPNTILKHIASHFMVNNLRCLKRNKKDLH